MTFVIYVEMLRELDATEAVHHALNQDRGSQLYFMDGQGKFRYAQGPDEHHFLSVSYIFLSFLCRPTSIPEVIKGSNYTGW